MRSEGAAPVAIVTGAAEGLGHAIVERLLADGYRVVASDINQEVHRSSNSAAGTDRIRAVVSDVAAADSGTELVNLALDAFGRLDAVVNNAGIAGPAASVERVSVGEIAQVFDVNVLGTVRLCQAAISHLKQQRAGRIVNLGSLYADQPVPDASAYCMSKAAVHALSQVLALELGPFGVTVNTVAPGLILTKMHRGAIASQAERLGVAPEQRERQLRESVPLERHGSPADIADAVSWLLSPGASYVTGQTIGVNGGLHFG